MAEVRPSKPAERQAPKIEPFAKSYVSADGTKIDVKGKMLHPLEQAVRQDTPYAFQPTFFPGWSMGVTPEDKLKIAGIPLGTGPAELAGQTYVAASQKDVPIINTRPEKVVTDSLWQQADAAVQFLREQYPHGEAIVPVGHSEGGERAAYVALKLQQQREELAKRGEEDALPNPEGLVLLDPVGLYDRGNWPRIDLTQTFVRDAFGRTPKFALKNSLQRMHAPEHRSEHGLRVGVATKTAIAIMQGTRLDAMLTEIGNMAGFTQEHQDRLAALKMPVVIVVGRNDLVAHPEKIFPDYKKYQWDEHGKIQQIQDSETGAYFDPAEKYLKERLFKNAPAVTLRVISGSGGLHGTPIWEDTASVSLAALAELKNPDTHVRNIPFAEPFGESGEPLLAKWKHDITGALGGLKEGGFRTHTDTGEAQILLDRLSSRTPNESDKNSVFVEASPEEGVILVARSNDQGQPTLDRFMFRQDDEGAQGYEKFLKFVQADPLVATEIAMSKRDDATVDDARLRELGNRVIKTNEATGDAGSTVIAWRPRK